MLFGAHLSVAGGLHRALELAHARGFDSVALFVRNPRRWQSKSLANEDVGRFKRVREDLDIKHVAAHASYLFNLAGDDEVREKSIAALTEDLALCDTLEIEHLVLHPGSHKDTTLGIDRIATGLEEVIGRVLSGETKILIETMAGQGHVIGATFEEIAEILEHVRYHDRLGVCLDTAHVFAAGYDLREPRAWDETMDTFDEIIGFDHLYAVHCNDSAKPFGSRLDRHAHIGLGEIGRRGFENLVNDPRLDDLPCILETPKGNREADGKEWDLVNVETLRSLQHQCPPPGAHIRKRYDVVCDGSGNGSRLQ